MPNCKHWPVLLHLSGFKWQEISTGNIRYCWCSWSDHQTIVQINEGQSCGIIPRKFWVYNHSWTITCLINHFSKCCVYYYYLMCRVYNSEYRVQNFCVWILLSTNKRRLLKFFLMNKTWMNKLCNLICTAFFKTRS